MQPWAEELVNQRLSNHGRDIPTSRCLPPGVPLLQAVPTPFKIVQTQGLVVILYEGWTLYRQVFTDGRELPKDPNPSWLGYSVATWNADTLVVDTVGLNDRSWLDLTGHPIPRLYTSSKDSSAVISDEWRFKSRSTIRRRTESHGQLSKVHTCFQILNYLSSSATRTKRMVPTLWGGSIPEMCLAG